MGNTIFSNKPKNIVGTVTETTPLLQKSSKIDPEKYTDLENPPQKIDEWIYICF